MRGICPMISRSKNFLILGPSASLFDPVSREPLCPAIFADQKQWNKLGPNAGRLGGPEFPKNEKIKISVEFKYLYLPPLIFSSWPNILYLGKDLQKIFQNIFGSKISLVPLESLSPMAVEIGEKYKACFFKVWIDAYPRDVPEDLWHSAAQEFYDGKTILNEIFSLKKIKNLMVFKNLANGSLIMQTKTFHKISKLCKGVIESCDTWKILIYNETIE
jgi:hypothetical protein